MANDVAAERQTELSVKKLELEVAVLGKQLEDLRAQSPEQKQLIASIPVVTTLIAVAAFVFSVVQFTNSQARDRESEARNREQVVRTQIRADLGELMKYTTDKSKTAASAVNLLTDLDELTKGNQTERDRITALLLQIVVYDFEFDEGLTEKEIRFDNIANDFWPDYLEYLQTHTATNKRLTNRYITLYEKYKNDDRREEVLRNALYRHGKRLANDTTGSTPPEEVRDLLGRVIAITGRKYE